MSKTGAPASAVNRADLTDDCGNISDSAGSARAKRRAVRSALEAGYAGPHADRLGQEPLLPAPRPGDGGNDGRRQPPDRADEGPDRVARGPGLEVVAVNSTLSAAEREEAERTIAAGPQGVRLHDPRAARRPRVPRPAEPGAHSTCSSSTRRTASASGATTSGPSTWAWARCIERAGPAARARPDGDGDPGGDRRHPRSSSASPTPRSSTPGSTAPTSTSP